MRRFHLMGNVSDFVIGMNRKHETLYHFLTFKTIDPLRYYPDEKGVPALLMQMDIEHSIKTTPKDFGVTTYFMRHPTPPEAFQDYFKWDAKSIYEFTHIHQNFWEKIPARAQKYLVATYPGLEKLIQKGGAST